MKKLLLTLTMIFSVSALAYAQGGALTGRVIDELGLPMPGASVVLTNAQKGIPTDANGYYISSYINTTAVNLLGQNWLNKF